MNLLDHYYQDKISIFNRSSLAEEREGHHTLESRINRVRENPGIFSSGHLISFADKYYNLKNDRSKPSLSIEIKWQLLHASVAHYNKHDCNTLNYGSEFGFLHLNASDLASLFIIINSFQIELSKEKAQNELIFRAIAFDMRDYLLRLCIHDIENAKEALKYLRERQSQDLDKTIEMMERTLNPSIYFPIFHPLVSRHNAIYHTIKETMLFPLSRQSSSSTCKEDEAIEIDEEKKPLQKLKIWKVALENSRDSIGGIASVVTAAYVANKKMNLDTVHSIHPLYSHNKLLVDLRFKGTIHHEFYGKIVTSSIYKNRATGEYFIQPDPRYNGIFDVSESKTLYRDFIYSSMEDRSAYLSSAIAVAASTYCGKKGTKSVDVLEAEGWHGSLAFELMNQHFDPIRLKRGLPRISRVFVTHMLVWSLQEQGLFSSKLLGKIGVDTTYLPDMVNLSDRALRLSHTNVFVSKGLVQDILSYDPELHKHLRDAANSGGPLKIRGIRNGINSSVFDVANPDSYGIYAVKNNNFLQAQNHVKQVLFNAGIIPDPIKPLLLFVGRFSSEKGIMMLPAALEEVKAQNGQMVIMGQRCEDEQSYAIVEKLQKLSETAEYKDVLKVHLDRATQMEPFTYDDPNCKVRKGWLLRQAASMVLVPSFAEACGLVPMETQCAGAITIVPRVQGLKDMCIPINSPHLTKKALNFRNGANAICYQNCHDQGELKQAIATAYLEYSCLTEAEKNSLMQKLRSYATQNYDWVIVKDGNIASGSAFEYSKLYHDLAQSLDGNPEVETLADALHRREQM